MPTYEYRCTSCGQHIEIVQSFTDDPLTECGACSGPLRKVFSPVGIVFKGSGFYKTDSRSGSKSASIDSKSESKSESKSDSKESKKDSSSSSSSNNNNSSSGKDAKIA